MKVNLPQTTEAEMPSQLLVTATAAANLLSISPRLLWSLTNARKYPAFASGGR